MIKIYGAPGCTKCFQLNKACKEKHLNIIYVEVVSGDVDFKMLLNAGVKSFPAVMVDNNIVSGKTVGEFLDIISLHEQLSCISQVESL